MTIGILGLGRIGLLFSQVLMDRNPDLHLVGYAPTPRDRYQTLINRWQFTFETDWGKFTHYPLDGYLIASPSDTHYDYINQLVFKGKPIFCEKPLDLSLERIERIQRLVEAYDATLTVGFNRRFDPDVVQLKKEIDAGRIGIPHIVRMTSRDSSPPSLEFVKSSGGIFLDQVIHDYDLIRFLLEADPVSIFAEASVLVDSQIEALDDFDTAVSTLRFDNGCLATIDNSRKAVYGYDQRIEVFGSEGMVSTRNQRPQSVVVHTKIGSQMHPYKDFFLERYERSYELEMENFLALCAGKTARVVDINDAWMATKIAVAAGESVRTKSPIEI